jgi:hypothetical protein
LAAQHWLLCWRQSAGGWLKQTLLLLALLMLVPQIGGQCGRLVSWHWARAATS